MCDSPYIPIKRGELVKGKVYNHDVCVPCGKCPVCKRRRVNDWVFRLQKEDDRSTSSYFITLTYDNHNVPISTNNFMTLRKSDFQKFMKRLRKNNKQKIRYYACGEYGTKTKRPHYHAIVFNVDNITNVFHAWTLGKIDVGETTRNSIAYCCKYIDKAKTIPLHARDDRIKEFSLMSNNIGLNYLTKKIKKYYAEDYKRYHVIREEQKQPLPRYYRKKLIEMGVYTEESLKRQTDYIQEIINVADTTAEQNHDNIHRDHPENYRENKELAKIERWRKHQKRTGNRNKL